ncbi:MAG: hypothetical protein QM783_17460 [Phycisphaerales bacterium]
MKTILTATAVLALAAAANADVISAKITADNHYALYTGDNSSVTLVGRNEMGSGGNPGTYNWSEPEDYSFNSGAFIYIVAWSDDSVAQGLMAQITGLTDTYHSGDSRWQVYPTFISRGDGDAEPDAAELIGHLTNADANNLWQNIAVGGGNGMSPWGLIPGIGEAPRWMWVNNPEQVDPFNGGSGYGETLVFRMAVPTPGAAAALGLGGLTGLRRKRR